MIAFHSFLFDAMNTQFEIRVPKSCLPFDQAKTIAVDIEKKIAYLEERLSRFIPSSDIANINHLEEGEYHILDPLTYHCLEKAMQAQQITHGYFNVQAGRFDTSPEITFGEYQLHEKDQAISCQKKGRSFDLGGIGKGYALDCVTDVFDDWDLKDYYLSAGNSTILVGNKTTPSWKPKISQQQQHAISLMNTAISGSGDRLNPGHIKRPLSPTTINKPLVKTWVQCASATFSDAFSTACSIMDPSQIERMIDTAPFDIVVFQEIDNQLVTYKKKTLINDSN